MALTHPCSGVPPKIVVWINDDFDDNFGIEKNFAIYLKRSCALYSEQYFSFKYFCNFAFASKISLKLSAFRWVALMFP